MRVNVNLSENKKWPWSKRIIYSLIKKVIDEKKEFDFTLEKTSDLIGSNKKTVSLTISELIKEGYFYQYSFDGHRRVLKARNK
jgi:hypothetical protein